MNNHEAIARGKGSSQARDEDEIIRNEELDIEGYVEYLMRGERMITVFCGMCGQSLKKPGALIFSPPRTQCVVHKTHICLQCYSKLIDWITGTGKRECSGGSGSFGKAA